MPVVCERLDDPAPQPTDVAGLLGYSNPSKAIADHCREKGITNRYPLETSGGTQEVTLINEPNVYRLISRSKLPSAEKFEAWLFEEVVPSIRKKGYYGTIDRSALPNFIIRYKDNYHKLPHTHFSVISEIFGVTLCHPKTLAEAEVVMDAIYAAMPDTSITQTS